MRYNNYNIMSDPAKTLFHAGSMQEASPLGKTHRGDHDVKGRKSVNLMLSLMNRKPANLRELVLSDLIQFVLFSQNLKGSLNP